MTFESDFPGLKDKRVNPQSQTGKDGDTIWIVDVQEFCLDRKKVKKAIDKIVRGEKTSIDALRKELKQELGL